MGINVLDQNNNVFYDPTFINITTITYQYYWEESLNKYIVNITEYPMQNCSNSPMFDLSNSTNKNLFNLSFNENDLFRVKIGNYLCPVGLDTNSFIGNMEFDTQFNVTSVLIAKCANTTSESKCKSIKEIDDTFSTLRTNMVFLNSNYDPSLQYPVTTFFDKRYQTGIDPNYKNRQVIELQEN